MTLEQLRIFVAVAERLHMTRAAEALGLTQSAASAAVAALEARHGTQLFDRVGRGLVLSDAGEAFLPEARAVLARAAAATTALEDLAGLRRGHVTLFASQTVASYWLPPRMVRFARAHPQISLDLSVGNTAQVARAVVEGDAELGFAEGAAADPLLAHRRVGADRLAILAAPSHPLTLAERVTLDDLASADWVGREPGSGTRSAFEHALADLGLAPERLRRLLDLPSNEAVLAAAAAGGTLAAVSELAARPILETVRPAPAGLRAARAAVRAADPSWPPPQPGRRRLRRRAGRRPPGDLTGPRRVETPRRLTLRSPVIALAPAGYRALSRIWRIRTRGCTQDQETRGQASPASADLAGRNVRRAWRVRKTGRRKP